MPDKRVLITGGTGFVGYWMKETKPALWLNVTYLNHDQYESMNWCKSDWDYIVHLANISPTDVINKAKECQARVLYASSGAAYNQQTEYAINKRKWEDECGELEHKLVIARIFACSGYMLKNYFALTNFIDDALHSRPIIIKGNGKSIRSYIYGSDLGRWLWRILLDGNATYAVGDTVEYTILQVAQAVASVIPAEIKLLNLPDVPGRAMYLLVAAHGLSSACKRMSL